MTVQLRALEHVTISSPFGVRFWDVVDRDFVRSGLRVSAREMGSPRVPSMFANGSGVWVVNNLRLKQPPVTSDEFRWGDGGPEFWTRWSTPVTTLELLVEDGEDRYMPYRFRAGAPQRGFVRRVCGEGPIDAMPVYPSPSRRAPAGMAVVRAQLAEPPSPSPPSERAPAAWTYVEVVIGGRVAGASFADQEGRVAVMFPWPAPLDNALMSPPGGSGANALINQKWRVTLRAYYGGLSRDSIPDLCDVLEQPAATLLDALPDVALAGQELAYGRELVVRSADTESPPVRNSDLLIRR